MSLVVVACVALIMGGVLAWLVRLHEQDQHAARAEIAAALRQMADAANEILQAERQAVLSHLEQEAQAAREERQRLLDRIQNPLGVAQTAWPVAEASRVTDEDVDREWLEGPLSQVDFDPDLVLADVEQEG